MSSSYSFVDPVTLKTRFFHGYLYDCEMGAPCDCPYAMRLNGGCFCNHPNKRGCPCGGDLSMMENAFSTLKKVLI